MSEKIRALPVEEKLEKHPMPQAATKQLQAMGTQIQQMQASMRLYLNGVLIGLGVDSESSAVNIDSDYSAYTVGPIER